MLTHIKTQRMTAEDYLKDIKWWDKYPDGGGEFWVDQWQLAEAMEAYADQKALEALEDNDLNRVEVINGVGRAYVNYDIKGKVELSFQDKRKTLKIFITE